MNFVTEALESLTKRVEVCKRDGWAQDAQVFTQIFFPMLTKSVKFLLPKDGDLGVHLSQKTMEFVRAPYQQMLFEYECSAPKHLLLTDDVSACASKRVVVVCEVSERTVGFSLLRALAPHLSENRFDDGLFIFEVYYVPEMKVWISSIVASFIPYNTTVDIADDGIPIVSGFPIPLLLDSFSHIQHVNNLTVEQLMQIAISDIAKDVHIALSALACINAKNVNAVTVEAPEKLNKKRARNGRPPFFEYKVLDIFLGAKVRALPSKERNKLGQQLVQGLGVRLHTVIGHFKKRKSGLYWWSPHVRGKKERGEIVKDYTVRTEVIA